MPRAVASLSDPLWGSATQAARSNIKAGGGGIVISFTIPGKPVPKARARVMKTGWSFTPKKTRDYEKMVKILALKARQGVKDWVLSGYYRLEVICYGAHPRSDWDNLGKAVSDALNGVIWVDDSQVVIGRVQKIKCDKGLERTDIFIEQVK